MSEKKKVPAGAGELIGVNVNVDKDDVAAILLARAETYLKGEIKRCQKVDSDLEQQLKTLTATLNKQLEATVKEHYKETTKLLKKAIATFKAKGVEIGSGVCGYDLDGGRAGIVYGSLQAYASAPAFSWNVEEDIPFDEAARATRTEIKKKQKQRAQNHDEWYEVRKKLADLPTLERRARAAVAEERLKANAGGKRLVEMLDGQLEESIKLLGVN